MKKQSSVSRKLRKYHAQRWRELHGQLKKYFKTHSNTSLHAARVEIKKLNALFHLAAYSNKEFDSDKQLKSLQKIFKLSGRLRDFKNENLLCEKFEVSKTILKKDRDSQVEIYKELKSKYRKYEKRFAKVEKTAGQTLRNIPDKKWSEYLHKIVRSLKVLLPEKMKANLHVHRKKVKEIVYLAKLSEELEIIILRKPQIELLDQLQNEIGLWHDLTGFSSKAHSIKDATAQLNFLQALEKEEKKRITTITKLSSSLRRIP